MRDLIETHLQRTKVDAHSAGSDTHSGKCRTSTAAQPILPSRNSLLYQLNISRTSVKDQHTRGTSASCQLNIRGPSEEHQNIRATAEEYQRSISQSGRLQVNISFRGARMKDDLKTNARTLVEAGLVLGVCDYGYCVYRCEKLLNEPGLRD